ncbi:MAG: ribosome biogenesis GTPase YlqF [Pseudomonadales bacterium]
MSFLSEKAHAMQIQWFPGHMYKASKKIKEIFPTIDLFIEVLDARIPFSSQNPMLEQLRKDKPCIKVLTKCDLADPVLTRQWQDYLEAKKNIKTLAVSSNQPERMLQLTQLARKMLPLKEKSVKSIQALIVGIPNVGKSTLINTIAGRSIAKTGNEPAVTKSQQRINLDNGIVLFDTPGMLWPNVENINSGYRLAITGAVKDTVVEYDDVAFFAAEYLLLTYPELLKERYELTELPVKELELLETIGKKRGCLRSGGHVDLEKVSKILINEFRDGTLGHITLETPSMMEKELIELEIIRARKAEKLAEKKLKKSGKRTR